MYARKIYDEIRWLTDFTVTEDHLKLLNQMNVGWDDMEFGAPAIDGKRPYGNSDVLGDIAEILELEPADEDGDFPDDQVKAMMRTHAEMALVLQIGIQERQFRTGRYTRPEKWSMQWTRHEA